MRIPRGKAQPEPSDVARALVPAEPTLVSALVVPAAKTNEDAKSREWEARLDVRFRHLEESLLEEMRTMQMELLHAFANFSTDYKIEFRKLETSQTDLDPATRQLLADMDGRLLRLLSNLRRPRAEAPKSLPPDA